MGKLTYLVIHTADTPYDKEFGPDDITRWHMGAKKNSDGTYTFLGKKRTENEIKMMSLKLPSGKILPAIKTKGNGWSVSGYADMIQRSGKLINLNPYDFDDKIDRWEITNGVGNKNSICRNIVLIGGWSKDGKIRNGHIDGDKSKPYFKIDDLYTSSQIKTLIDYVRMQKEIYPDLKVVGHNDLYDKKTCPNFVVSEFLKDYNV